MTRAVMQLVRMHTFEPDYRLPDDPGFVSCRPREPNDRCGGCDECLAMQYGYGPFRDEVDPCEAGEQQETPCPVAPAF